MKLRQLTIIFYLPYYVMCQTPSQIAMPSFNQNEQFTNRLTLSCYSMPNQSQQ